MSQISQCLKSRNLKSLLNEAATTTFERAKKSASYLLCPTDNLYFPSRYWTRNGQLDDTADKGAHALGAGY